MKERKFESKQWEYCKELCFYSIFLFKIQQEEEAKETGPWIARANLYGPDLQLLMDKINITGTTFITIKTLTRAIQTEFREGKEITRKTKKLKNQWVLINK